jgi:phosphoribosylformylglycinamidine (FGAM) synthase PurS component
MGHGQISNVRQGKYFEIEIGDFTNEQEALQLVEQIARDVLSNAIIESFEIEEIS